MIPSPKHRNTKSRHVIPPCNAARGLGVGVVRGARRHPEHCSHQHAALGAVDLNVAARGEHHLALGVAVPEKYGHEQHSRLGGANPCSNVRPSQRRHSSP